MPVELATNWQQHQNNFAGAIEKRAAEAAKQIAAVLDDARQVIAIPHWGAVTREHLRGSIGDYLDQVLHQLVDNVERSFEAMSRDEMSRLYNLSLRLQRLRNEQQLIALEYHIQQLTAIHTGTNALSPTVGVARLLEHAASEFGKLCGLDRTMVLQRVDNSLVLTATYMAGHDSLAAHYQSLGEQAPLELLPNRLETRIVRMKRAALVFDPLEDANAFQPIVQMLETQGYAAAPVIVHGEVVATLHGDAFYAGRRVDAMDREALGTFAASFGRVVERAVLLEQMQAQRDGLNALLANADQSIHTAAEGSDALTPLTPVTPMQPRQMSNSHRQLPPSSREMPPPRPPSRQQARRSAVLDQLTPREAEVLGLMTTGATNADIARQLVIAEGTVKTHVKKILRKTGAASRGQAVATYLRLASPCFEAPPTH